MFPRGRKNRAKIVRGSLGTKPSLLSAGIRAGYLKIVKADRAERIGREDERGAFKVMAFHRRCYKFICHNLLCAPLLLACLYMLSRGHTHGFSLSLEPTGLSRNDGGAFSGKFSATLLLCCVEKERGGTSLKIRRKSWRELRSVGKKSRESPLLT